jgi:hypothetical protein
VLHITGVDARLSRYSYLVSLLPAAIVRDRRAPEAVVALGGAALAPDVALAAAVADIPGFHRPEAIKLVLREMETPRAVGLAHPQQQPGALLAVSKHLRDTVGPAREELGRVAGVVVHNRDFQSITPFVEALPLLLLASPLRRATAIAFTPDSTLWWAFAP